MNIIEQTKQSMKQLRLSGMEQEYALLQTTPSLRPDSVEDYLAKLLQAEIDNREKKRLARSFKVAKLRHKQACLESIDYTVSRGLEKSKVSALANCNWIDESQNILLTGLSGVGKTYLACALANQAIRLGYSVWYKRFTELIEELELAQATGELPKLRAKIVKIDLLVIDDWGITPLSAQSRLHVLDIVEQRAGIGSLIITAQLPIEGWYEYIGEPTIADAILDRVIHRSHKINLHGESMRKIKESIQGE